MTETQTLIADLEQAEEGSRELDWRTHKAKQPWLGKAVRHELGHVDADGSYSADTLLWYVEGRAEPYYDALPHYSTSIDAALQLVPLDVDLGFNMDVELVRGGWCGYVWLDHPTNKDSYSRTRPRETRRECIEEIPLVICIAALKARQASGEAEG